MENGGEIDVSLFIFHSTQQKHNIEDKTRQDKT